MRWGGRRRGGSACTVGRPVQLALAAQRRGVPPASPLSPPCCTRCCPMLAPQPHCVGVVAQHTALGRHDGVRSAVQAGHGAAGRLVGRAPAGQAGARRTLHQGRHARPPAQGCASRAQAPGCRVGRRRSRAQGMRSRQHCSTCKQSTNVGSSGQTDGAHHDQYTQLVSSRQPWMQASAVSAVVSVPTGVTEAT